MAPTSRSNKPKQKKPWQDIAQEAQTYRDASIASFQAHLPQFPSDRPKNVFSLLRDSLREEDIAVTETLPEELLVSLAAGKLTATAVTTAFLRRASLAQKLVCAWNVEGFLYQRAP